MKMQPKDKRKSKKEKEPKYEKSFRKNSDDEEEGYGIQERLDVKDVKESQAGCRRRCEGKKEKKGDGEKERGAKEKSRETKGRGLAREEGAQDKNTENRSEGSECGGGGNKSCVPS